MLSIEQRKRLFAQQYIVNPQAIYQAAVNAWPDDPAMGLRLAKDWAVDNEVHAYCREMVAGGMSVLIPAKDQLAQEILAIGRNKVAEDQDRIKAYELVAKIMGYIAPPQTNVNTKTVVNSPVMVVRDHGEQWEQRAIEQQQHLISNHGSKH